jgi:hypothetical protein
MAVPAQPRVNAANGSGRRAASFWVWRGVADGCRLGHIEQVRLADILVLAVGATISSCKGPDSTEQSASATPVQAAASSGPRAIPATRDGDLVFHESTSRQSSMVRALTRSSWTHMGVVFNEGTGPVVLEAVSPVRKTPLAAWISRGKDRRYVLKRLRAESSQLPSEVTKRMRALGFSWLGRPYDLRFRWDDEALYCSELAYKLFERGAGIRLGKVERAMDMNLDDPLVKKALQKRFAGSEFEPDEPVVTPDSIFNDPQLVEVDQK